MTTAEIIVALGDTGEVAKALGIADNTVSNWKQRGIPWRWKPRVAILAKERKVMLPADFLVDL